MKKNSTLVIDVFYKDFSHIGPMECLEDIKYLTIAIERLRNESRTWLLTGYSKKEALKHQLFEGDQITEKALKSFERSYKESMPGMVETVWDGGSDDDGCGITYMRADPKKGSLIITITLSTQQDVINKDNLLMFINTLIQMRNTLAICVCDTQSSEKKMFPERMPAGWMLYLNKTLHKEQIPEAADVIAVSVDDEQIGSIIVSVEGVFDGNNPEHIHKANDIEIRLVDLDVLPHYLTQYNNP